MFATNVFRPLGVKSSRVARAVSTKHPLAPVSTRACSIDNFSGCAPIRTDVIWSTLDQVSGVPWDPNFRGHTSPSGSTNSAVEVLDLHQPVGSTQAWCRIPVPQRQQHPERSKTSSRASRRRILPIDPGVRLPVVPLQPGRLGSRRRVGPPPAALFCHSYFPPSWPAPAGIGSDELNLGRQDLTEARTHMAPNYTIAAGLRTSRFQNVSA